MFANDKQFSVLIAIRTSIDFEFFGHILSFFLFIMFRSRLIMAVFSINCVKHSQYKCHSFTPKNGVAAHQVHQSPTAIRTLIECQYSTVCLNIYQPVDEEREISKLQIF